MGKSIVNSGPWAEAGVNSIALLESGWFCAAEGWLEQFHKDYEVYQEIAYVRNIEALILSGWIEAENARLKAEVKTGMDLAKTNTDRVEVAVRASELAHAAYLKWRSRNAAWG